MIPLCRERTTVMVWCVSLENLCLLIIMTSADTGRLLPAPTEFTLIPIPRVRKLRHKLGK